MMFWYGAHWAFWQAGLMWLGVLVFWGLVIWAVYALIASVRRPPRGDQSEEPRRILDERLVRGEIDETDYRRLRELITDGARTDRAGSAGAR